MLKEDTSNSYYFEDLLQKDFDKSFREIIQQKVMTELPKPSAFWNIVAVIKPKRIIFNPPMTIVYWDDGTKTIVKASNEQFVDEFGFAMALIKKLFPSRNKFLKMINEAYHQESNE